MAAALAPLTAADGTIDGSELKAAMRTAVNAWIE
jgi:hypothetical protein